MAIVSISRGSNSKGAEVAEKVARQLGCECLSREDVIRDSGLTSIPESEIVRALEEPPSFLERLLPSKVRYISSARAGLLNRLCAPNVVYHGFAGHYFLKEVSHALKVRVLSELPDRVALMVQRDGITPAEARARLLKKDAARRQWALRVYGLDPEDPCLYDAVLHVGKLGTDDAVEIICDLAGDDAFKATRESLEEVSALASRAAVEAVLMDMEVDLDTVSITVRHGNVMVHLRESRRTRAGSSSEFRKHYVESLRHRVHERTRNIPGLKAVHLEYVDD